MKPARNRLVIISLLVTFAGAAAWASADEGAKHGETLPERPVVASPSEEPSPELERLAIPQPSGRADTPLVAPIPVSPSR